MLKEGSGRSKRDDGRRQMANVLCSEELSRLLAGGVIGRRVEVHRIIDSTNVRARQMAALGEPHGTLVCARQQTGGKGRMGRQFYSPEDAGIYMSLILRPALPAARSVMITSMTAVAVARAIERLAEVQVEIKWVNDLYINGKKAGGILCEAELDCANGTLEYAVVGIGVNVAAMKFPKELSEIATSIGNEWPGEVSRNRLVAEICREIEALYPQLSSGAFLPESRRRSNVIGRRVIVIRGNERFTAKALDIDDDGGLFVETEAGRYSLQSGEISLRWEEN